MSCVMQKDPDGKLSRVVHMRIIRKQMGEMPTDADAEPIEMCDGQHHWRYFGWGPGVRQDRWLYEVVIEPCPDFAEIRREEFIGRHGDMERTFANFIVADDNRDAYARTKGWRKTAFKTLILHGATGRGKTHLAKAVQNEFLRDFDNTAFITAAEMHEVFIKAQPAAREYDLEAMQQLAEIREAKLFVLDDLGAERQTSGQFFQVELLKLLNGLTGRMVITSNLAPNEMEKRYDAKIMSRVMEQAVAIPLFGKDHRRGK